MTIENPELMSAPRLDLVFGSVHQPGREPCMERQRMAKKGSGKAAKVKERQWKGSESQGKVVQRQRKVKERQWKGRERSRKRRTCPWLTRLPRSPPPQETAETPPCQRPATQAAIETRVDQRDAIEDGYSTRLRPASSQRVASAQRCFGRAGGSGHHPGSCDDSGGVKAGREAGGSLRCAVCVQCVGGGRRRRRR